MSESERANPLTVAVAWSCFTVGLLLVGFDVFRLTMTGVAVIGVLLLLVWARFIGVFTRRFWVADDAQSADLSELDAELARYGRDVPSGADDRDRWGRIGDAAWGGGAPDPGRYPHRS